MSSKETGALSEFEQALVEWRGGGSVGPPPWPPCPYCHSYKWGCPMGGCRAPKESS